MCASVNLSGRVAVPEYMASDLRGDVAYAMCVKTHAMAQRPGRESPMWQPSRHEDFTGRGVSRTTTSQVRCKSPCDGRQERQLERNGRLGPTRSNDTAAPIDILQPKGHDLARAEAVGSHKQKNGKVAPSQRLVARNCPDDPAHRIPRQGTRRPLVDAKARSDDTASEIAIEATRAMQETQEAAQ
jgi:hypothetical protein